ncbi:hypothetical protein [Lacrimispora sp.]|uniref:hypothetical protein n=1 Tax=Lacrimispora sp. TaxID=2719234 RepID=UPI00289CED23|nr:hypothetical protein [Lacrimispora sp.]
MKKVITYTEEQVLQIQYLLNAVTVTGIQNAKQIAAIAQILEMGTPGEIKEPERKDKFNGVYSPVDWEPLPEREIRISNEKKKEGAG